MARVPVPIRPVGRALALTWSSSINGPKATVPTVTATSENAARSPTHGHPSDVSTSTECQRCFERADTSEQRGHHDRQHEQGKEGVPGPATSGERTMQRSYGGQAGRSRDGRYDEQHHAAERPLERRLGPGDLAGGVVQDDHAQRQHRLEQPELHRQCQGLAQEDPGRRQPRQP